MTSNYSDLERLSAVETLKQLNEPDKVTIDDLVCFLKERDMWAQFSKITLGDLRAAFSPVLEAKKTKRGKTKISAEITGDEPTKKVKRAPTDGGLSTDEVARSVLPFVEGNGDVTFDDLAEYTELDRKVLRHHLGVMVKEGVLDRMGTGRGALYSTLG
jgi:DNA-binding transcriptional ArsR family regulator